MKDVLGLVNLVSEQTLLPELTEHQCLASVPFAGKYRLIDFVLSNMVNSGIKNIGLLIHDKYRLLLEHVGSGEEWDLNRKKAGLFILPPDGVFEVGYKGEVQNFCANLEYLYESIQEYVVISGTSMVCNMTYNDAINFHVDKEADITLIYTINATEQDLQECSLLKMTSDGRITSVSEHTGIIPSNSAIALNMMIIKKALLIDLIKECIRKKQYHLTRDVIAGNLHKLKVYGYPFAGYVAIIDSLKNYYNYSLELLHPEIYQELFLQKEVIYTKSMNEPPTQYLEASEVKNSLLANGCLIEGKVENSILSTGVKLEQGAIVKNSIIMPGCEIQKSRQIENCIVDKDQVFKLEG